jgi:hypothetical protein
MEGQAKAIMALRNCSRGWQRTGSLRTSWWQNRVLVTSHSHLVALHPTVRHQSELNLLAFGLV